MEKIFFIEGDLVTLRQDLPNKPVMLVQSVDKSTMAERPMLLGITCIWFTKNNELQKHRYNTKDLERA